MKFKHILKRVRQLLANKANGKFDGLKIANNEERKVKLSLSSSENNNSEASSSSDRKSNDWRQMENYNKFEIIIKPPSLHKKSMKQTKISLYNEDKELSVIEEISHINLRFSKNDLESFASNHTLVKFLKSKI